MHRCMNTNIHTHTYTHTHTHTHTHTNNGKRLDLVIYFGAFGSKPERGGEERDEW